MPVFAAAAIPFWTAAATAGGAVAGAALSSSGVKSAAETQASAAEKAAELQSQSAANTLAFQKQQAAQDLATQNAIQQANYNQWAARQQRLSQFGQTIGLPAQNIPAYNPIPGATPNASGSTPSGAPSGALVPPGTDPKDPAAIQSALTKFYQQAGVQPTGRGSGPTDIAYYADQIAQTGGLTPQNMAYWFGPNGNDGRIASDLGKTGGAAGSASTQAASPSNSFAATLNQAPVTASYSAPNPAIVQPYTPVNSFAQIFS